MYPHAGLVKSVSLSPLDNSDVSLLLLIRYFELALLRLFTQGQLSGTTHTCLGQEYIPVSLRPLLLSQDFIFSNHRGHGHYLARFADPAGLLAEIMGREGAICYGVGGSQHIYRGEGYLSTGVQGESLPVAVGVALHFKKQRKDALAIVYIGDGTWGEGSVYESLNIACLWQLPLVVIVENNHIAQSTPTVAQMAGNIEDRARAFGCNYLHLSTMDISTIRAHLAPAFQHVRENSTPLVVEFSTLRLGPHSKGDDTRAEADLADLRRQDWYYLYSRQFPAQIARIEAEVARQIDALVDEISQRSLTTWEVPWEKENAL